MGRVTWKLLIGDEPCGVADDHFFEAYLDLSGLL